MKSLWTALLCASLAACANDTPEQHAARAAALARMGAIVANGGAVAATPAPAPMPNILPPPPLRCTSSRDYMGQIHTICQ